MTQLPQSPFLDIPARPDFGVDDAAAELADEFSKLAFTSADPQRLTEVEEVEAILETLRKAAA